MSTPDLVIVGSIGIDTIETPTEQRPDILGGSASYACAAASFFCPTGMVGVVGSDFPEEYKALYSKLGIDLTGLQIEEGATFRWSGRYEANMDNRSTLSTDLNVFEHFSPELPKDYLSSPFLFLGNIQPSLQLHVLDQIADPRFVLVDTMDLWINIALDDLKAVIGRVDMLTLNESEARHLMSEIGSQSTEVGDQTSDLGSQTSDLDLAAEALLALGPKYVIIKLGAQGSALYSANGRSYVPAFLLESVTDPTGAGDSFAGAFIAALAKGGQINDETIRAAMIYGSAVAAFGCEAFSLERLEQLDLPTIEARAADLRKKMK